MAGFSYVTALRLIGVAGQFWREIDGACARQGFDPIDLPIDRFLNMVYTWYTDRLAHVEAKDRDAAMLLLFQPVGGYDPDAVTQDVVDEEMSMFNAFARQNGPGGS